MIDRQIEYMHTQVMDIELIGRPDILELKYSSSISLTTHTFFSLKRRKSTYFSLKLNLAESF